MRKIRNNVFETNSSTTHSLVLFDQIKACGISVDNSKEVTITLIPLFDNSNKYDLPSSDWQAKQNEMINSLNHVSYMVDYLYTRIMLVKYNIESEHKQDDNPGAYYQEREDECADLINKMQQYLINLGYKITYKQPLIFNDELISYNKIYVEYNDGSTLDCIEDIEELLKDERTFKEYITKYAWVIDYEG